MKRGIISMLITLAAMSAAKADNIQEIHLDGSKRLGELIDRESGIDSLIVSGRMTDEDFKDLGTFCNECPFQPSILLLFERAHIFYFRFAYHRRQRYK